MMMDAVKGMAVPSPDDAKQGRITPVLKEVSRDEAAGSPVWRNAAAPTAQRNHLLPKDDSSLDRTLSRDLGTSPSPSTCLHGEDWDVASTRGRSNMAKTCTALHK
jgi:hypothetical protein